MIWGLAFAAIAAVFMVIATRVVVTRTRQLSTAQDSLSEAKDKQLAFDLRDKNLKIAEAQREAANARLALEEFKAPRRLTDKQAQEISSELKVFSGHEFDILEYLLTSEPLALQDQLYRVLVGATWKYIDFKAYRPVLAGDGVLVSRHPNADSNTKKAADLLVKALSSRGIAAELRANSPESIEQNRVRIQVGAKPQ